MKDNKGFTLVELLAVITLLALVAVAAFETIDSVNRGNKEKAEKVHTQNILNSAISFVPTSDVILPDVVKGTTSCKTNKYKKTANTIAATTNVCSVEVYLSRLVTEGVLEDNLKNPLKDKLLNMDTSYIEIIFLTPSTKYTVDGKVGKYDGSYFYQVIEVYK
jgi:prepilin-type N-terminal cleavage/methylation domain